MTSNEPFSSNFSFRMNLRGVNPGKRLASPLWSVATAVAIAFATLWMASCANGDSKTQWQNPVEAVSDYRKFHQELIKVSDHSMTAISKDIVAWQTLEDTIVRYIKTDTVKRVHSYPLEDIDNIHDSIRSEFLNRVMAQHRTFADVVTLKTTCSSLGKNEALQKTVGAIAPFFRSLDSIAVYNDNAATIVSRYSVYLKRVEKSGIHSKAGLLNFLREEDRLFRSFIRRMPEMGGISASDITQRTENIFSSAIRGNEQLGISGSDLLVLMTMRNNRRLLHNSLACLADIKANKLKDADQRKPYLLMILQPFLAIDELGYLVMTEEQQTQLQSLAKDAPAAVTSLARQLKMNKDYPSNVADFLCKLYVSTL